MQLSYFVFQTYGYLRNTMIPVIPGSTGVLLFIGSHPAVPGTDFAAAFPCAYAEGHQ